MSVRADFPLIPLLRISPLPVEKSRKVIFMMMSKLFLSASMSVTSHFQYWRSTCLLACHMFREGTGSPVYTQLLNILTELSREWEI